MFFFRGNTLFTPRSLLQVGDRGPIDETSAEHDRLHHALAHRRHEAVHQRPEAGHLGVLAGHHLQPRKGIGGVDLAEVQQEHTAVAAPKPRSLLLLGRQGLVLLPAHRMRPVEARLRGPLVVRVVGHEEVGPVQEEDALGVVGAQAPKVGGHVVVEPGHQPRGARVLGELAHEVGVARRLALVVVLLVVARAAKTPLLPSSFLLRHLHLVGPERIPKPSTVQDVGKGLVGVLAVEPKGELARQVEPEGDLLLHARRGIGPGQLLELPLVEQIAKEPGLGHPARHLDVVELPAAKIGEDRLPVVLEGVDVGHLASPGLCLLRRSPRARSRGKSPSMETLPLPAPGGLQGVEDLEDLALDLDQADPACPHLAAGFGQAPEEHEVLALDREASLPRATSVREHGRDVELAPGTVAVGLAALAPGVEDDAAPQGRELVGDLEEPVVLFGESSQALAESCAGGHLPLLYGYQTQILSRDPPEIVKAVLGAVGWKFCPPCGWVSEARRRTDTPTSDLGFQGAFKRSEGFGDRQVGSVRFDRSAAIWWSRPAQDASV